jgi:phosphate transport system substrate-binding protein
MQQHTTHYRSHDRIPSVWILALLAVALVASACSSGSPAAQDAASASDASAATEGEETTITISGAFALFPLATIWGDEYSKLHPNVRFDIQGGGAGKGMTDMLTGAVDVAMLSRDPRQEELDQGSVLVPVAIDSVLGSINAANPNLAQILAKGITPESGAAIWVTQESKTWGDLLGNGSTDPINVYTRSDAAGAAESWVKYLGGSAQEELKGTAVNADPGLAEAVRQDQFGIGYNNVGFLYDPATGLPTEGLAVVPLDIDGDGVISEQEQIYDTRDEFVAAAADGKYPFPPARVLYFVTKGDASPAIQEWYEWVLTKGQQFVTPAGYVALTQDRIDEALGTLNAE